MSGGGVTLGLSTGLRQTLEVRADLKLELRIIPTDLMAQFEAVYDRADKRTYDKHGLEFIYAVVRRQDFPYMLSLGSAGMFAQRTFLGIPIGPPMRFVMEDFFLDPTISPDFRAQCMELVAVHEYGESVFGSHHEASLLEFEVARREKVLEEYLAFMHRNYSLKFRDIALNRMGPELIAALGAAGVKVEEEVEEGLPELVADDRDSSLSWKRAMELRDAFRWPPALHARYSHALDEDPGVVQEKMGEWAHLITVNEQVLSYLRRAESEAVAASRAASATSTEPSVVIPPGLAAFGWTLHPLAEEFDVGTLDVKYLEPHIVSPALDTAYTNIREALGPLGEQIPAALEADPFFKKTLEDHLGIIREKQTWVENFGAAFILRSETEISDNARRVALDWLGRLIRYEVQRGRPEDQARRTLLSHAGILGWIVHTYLQEADRLPNDATLRTAWFATFVPYQLAFQAQNCRDGTFPALSTPLLQTALDAMAAYSGIPNPLSAEKLRERYGRDLGRFPDIHAARGSEDQGTAKRWATVATQVETRESLNFIAEKIVPPQREGIGFWDRNEQVTAIWQQIREGGIPEPLAIPLIQRLLERYFIADRAEMTPLLFSAYQEGVAAEYVPLLVTSVLLSHLIELDQGMTERFQYSLTSPAAWQALTRDDGPLANLMGATGKEDIARQTLERDAVDWMATLSLDPAKSDNALAVLRRATAPVDLVALKADVDATLEEAGIHVTDVDSKKQRLAAEIRYGDFRHLKHWWIAQIAEVQRVGPEGHLWEIQSPDRVVREALTLKSAQDALRLVGIFGGSFPSGVIRPYLTALDARRREVGVAILLQREKEEMSERVRTLPPTLVDLDFLTTTFGETPDWENLLTAYTNLLLFISTENAASVRNTATSDSYLETFSHCGRPVLERGATLARAVRGHLTSLEEIMSERFIPARATTDEERKTQGQALQVLRDPNLPLPEGAQYIPLYRRLFGHGSRTVLGVLGRVAAGGSLPALSLLTERVPGLSREEKQKAMGEINLDRFRENVEALPVLGLFVREFYHEGALRIILDNVSATSPALDRVLALDDLLPRAPLAILLPLAEAGVTRAGQRIGELRFPATEIAAPEMAVRLAPYNEEMARRVAVARVTALVVEINAIPVDVPPALEVVDQLLEIAENRASENVPAATKASERLRLFDGRGYFKPLHVPEEIARLIRIVNATGSAPSVVAIIRMTRLGQIPDRPITQEVFPICFDWSVWGIAREMLRLQGESKYTDFVRANYAVYHLQRKPYTALVNLAWAELRWYGTEENLTLLQRFGHPAGGAETILGGDYQEIGQLVMRVHHNDWSAILELINRRSTSRLAGIIVKHDLDFNANRLKNFLGTHLEAPRTLEACVAIAQTGNTTLATQLIELMWGGSRQAEEILRAIGSWSERGRKNLAELDRIRSGGKSTLGRRLPPSLAIPVSTGAGTTTHTIGAPPTTPSRRRGGAGSGDPTASVESVNEGKSAGSISLERGDDFFTNAGSLALARQADPLPQQKPHLQRVDVKTLPAVKPSPFAVLEGGQPPLALPAVWRQERTHSPSRAHLHSHHSHRHSPITHRVATKQRHYRSSGIKPAGATALWASGSGMVGINASSLGVMKALVP